MPLPLRPVVKKLADDIAAERLDADAAVQAAWRENDVESVAAYAFAAAVAKKPLPAPRVLPALPLLSDIDLAPALVASAAGDRVSVLLDVAESDERSDERDAIALYFATILRKRRPFPPRLLTLLRTHARRAESLDAGDLLVAAALVAEDPEVLQVMKDVFPDITKKHADAAVARVKGAFERPILEQLPEAPKTALALGIPVRRVEPKVGRNDPCPCGSGKKYKKCHEGKSLAPADPEAARGKQLEAVAKSLTTTQLAALSVQDLAALPFDDLAPKVRMAAFLRLADERRWEEAERAMVSVAKTRKDGKIDDLRLELVVSAFRARARDVARAHAAKLAEAGFNHPLVEVMNEVASPSRWTLSRLEKVAARGLSEDPDALFDLAEALLADHPGLGILFARAALTPERPAESYDFLALVEEARDRLGLPPNDLAGDIYDAMEALWGERADREEREQHEGDATLDELMKERESLRSGVREAGDRIVELEKKLRAQEERLAQDKPAQAQAQPDPERRKLRDQIAELKALIAEGNAERAELRRKIAERGAPPARGAAAPPQAPAKAVEEAGDAEGERAPEEAPRVRGVLVPRLSRATEASLRDLPARVVRDTLRVIADLCGGEPSVWREVKQLERISPPMYSARVGIHYRLLFRFEAGALDVAEIVPRQGLDAAIKRLM